MKSFTINLTEKVKSTDWIPIVGRTDDLDLIKQILLRKDKPNVLLVGYSGVGKTKLVEGLAYDYLTYDKNTTFLQLDTLSLMSNIGIKGELENRIKNLYRIMMKKENIILFIDEIHRLSHSVEEVLYSAMEDFALDIIIGKGPSARSIRLDIAPFTLIGATTKAGALASPLRDRFGVISRLEYYTPESLVFIIKRSAEILNIPIEDRGALEIARRSRGTPRVANRLLKRVRDFAQIKGDGIITDEIADTALAMLEIDKMGLDHIDRNILLTMINKFGGGPVGLETLAAAVSEETDTIGDVYEPYLLQLGFINRTPRGRVVTKLGYEHLGLTKTE